jgi:hypothetical protein
MVLNGESVSREPSPDPMDVTLYAIALAVFTVLYIAIGVFLAFALIITLLILFTYLAVRYPGLPQSYPHSAADAITTMIFIGVTWAIFTFVADKTPIPFIGSGLTYTNQSLVPFDAIILITFVVSIVFLLVFAFLASRKEGPDTAPPDDSSKPKQGVGA